MSRFIKLFALVLVLFVFAFGVVDSASAAPALVPAFQDTPATFDLDDLLVTAKTLTGVALFWAAVQNFGKLASPKLFPDNSAPKWTLATQTITLVALVALQLSGRAELIPVIDQNAGMIANLLTAFIALAYQFLVARTGHQNVLAGLPGIGFSHSGRVAGESLLAEVLVTRDPEPVE